MKKTVGIDIGNYSIKLVELEDKKTHLELTRCGINPIINGGVKPALKDLLLLTKLSLKRVNASLSGSSVIVRYIEMPSMKKEELKSAVKFEAERYIPFNINESVIDCMALGKSAKSATGGETVLLAAAGKRDVNNLLGILKDGGLEVNVIDIDNFAVLNSFQRLGKNNKEDTYAFLNMGAKFCNMNIVRNGCVCFTRDVLCGGMDITDRIKDTMGLSLEEAERLKRNPEKKREEVFNAVTSVLERLTSQIRMSFDYFESQFGKNVEKIYISGGTSYLFDIAGFLKDNLGVDIIMWNPFENIKISEGVTEEAIGRFPAVFAVAVGLALRDGR